MHKRLHKIQLIRGSISVGKRGGILLYNDRMGIDFVALFIWKYGLQIIIIWTIFEQNPLRLL